MANHFNDLLLQTLKQINVRLDRLDTRVEQKADKADLDAINKKLDGVIETKADKTALEVPDGKFDDVLCCLDRIDAELRTLTWIIGTEVAIIGVVLIFI